MKKYPTINYIGNKDKITQWIIGLLPEGCNKVVDIFSGGCSVSYALKCNGYEVITNDMLYSNYSISKAIIENGKDILLAKDYKNINISEEDILNEYNRLSFLVNTLYFDYEVKELAKLILVSHKLKDYKKSMFLSLLRRAMIRKIPYSRMNVSWNEIVKLRDEEYSYKKYGRKRAYHNQTFEYHIDSYLDEYNQCVFDSGKENKSYQLDVLKFCKVLPKDTDIIYMDPPYPSTMNNYYSFYGTFDKIFNKEIEERLDLSTKATFLENFEKIIKKVHKKTKYVVISLNNKTVPSSDEIIKMLEKYSEQISVFEKKHDYKITGKENKKTNYEILIIAKTKKEQ